MNKSARYEWSGLNHQQLGAYAEYFVKMELTMFGFQVYGTEVDDRGIDFVARRANDRFLRIQVKSVLKSAYVFMQKSKFELAADVYLALVLFRDGKPPEVFFIPALAWNSTNSLFCDRPYGEGKKSKPEWGLSLSAKNRELLQRYRFENMIDSLS